MMSNKRIHIPNELRRQLLVECGHKCTIHLCDEKTTLDVHHINGNPSDNRKENLIVLCANHHRLAEKKEIDRKALVAHKNRLKLSKPTESLKEIVDREGIDVIPETGFMNFVLSIGRKYMIWRYGKPTASIKKEVFAVILIILACFIPFFYIVWFLKAQVSFEWILLSTIGLLVGAFLIVFLSIIVIRRCDNCHGYFGIHRVESKEVDKKILELEHETRITTTYRNTYKCIYCNNTYTKNENETETITKD